MAPNNANNANNATSDQRVNGMQCNVKTALLKRNQVVGQFTILSDLGGGDMFPTILESSNRCATQLLRQSKSSLSQIYRSNNKP